MFGISGIAKVAVSGLVVAATVAVVTQMREGEDIRSQAAGLFRMGARGARFVADKADLVADYLEEQDSEEYVNAQWAKIEKAQGSVEQ